MLAENLSLSRPIRLFFIIVGVIVIVGVGLLFAPDLVRPHWPWVIAPFNSAFLGSVYAAELVSVVTLVLAGRLAVLRTIAPVALSFVGIVSVVTLLYLNKLDYTKAATYAWFVAYFGSVLVLLYIVIKYRKQLVNTAGPARTFWRVLLLAHGIALILYGLGLLILPGTFDAFWPWKIDAFHSQVYSAVFISGGIGSLILAQGGSRIEHLVLGLIQVFLGIFAIGGIAVVDTTQHRVNWSLPGTILWLLIFVWLMIVGLGLILKSRQPDPAAIQTPASIPS